MSAATASSILRTRLQQHSGPPRPHSAAGGLPTGGGGGRDTHANQHHQHQQHQHQQHHHSMPSSTTTTTTAASLLSERALCPPTFPSTFRDFFSELCSEEVVFLEEKLIPRRGAAPEDGNHSTDTSATEEETESRPRSLMRSSLRGRKGSVRLGRRRRASLGGGVGEGGGGGGGGGDTLSLPFGCALKERCSSARSSLGGPDRCFRAPSPLPSLQRLDAVEGKEEDEEEEEEDYDEEDEEEAGRRWAGARVASRGAFSEEADLPPPGGMAGRRRSSSIPAPLPARVQTRTATALLNPGAVNELQTAFADWPGRRRLSPGAVVIAGGSFKARSSRVDTPRHGSQGEHIHHGGSTEAGFRPRTSSMPAVTRQRPMLGRCRRRGVLGPGFSVASGGGGGGCPGGSDEAGGGEYYRLRSFSITSKGVINCGDSFRSRRRSRSINSVSSVASSQSGGGGGGRGDVAGGSGRDRIPSSASQCTTTTNGSIGEDTDSFPERGDDGFGVEPASYRVVMLGASGVGKTALTTQFTTSEYMCAYDASLDDEYGKKTVSVMLNGEESELEIVDHPASEMSVESYCTTYNPDVFVVVYSITDRESLERAEDILSFLSKADLMATKAVILVGNKTDLERSRVITTSGGRYLANKYECKFIEASGGIDHNVDELLVGILAQAKLNASREQQRQARQQRHQRQQRHLLQRLHHRHSGGENNNESDSNNQQASSSKKARKKQSRMGNVGGGGVAKAQRILNKLLRMDSKSRSCENLHVL